MPNPVHLSGWHYFLCCGLKVIVVFHCCLWVYAIHRRKENCSIQITSCFSKALYNSAAIVYAVTKADLECQFAQCFGFKQSAFVHFYLQASEPNEISVSVMFIPGREQQQRWCEGELYWWVSVNKRISPISPTFTCVSYKHKLRVLLCSQKFRFTQRWWIQLQMNGDFPPFCVGEEWLCCHLAVAIIIIQAVKFGLQ